MSHKESRVKQKEIFLSVEANSWFERNSVVVNSRDYKDDFLLKKISDVIEWQGKSGKDISLLEIGCGEGKRLQIIKDLYDINCYGIDPSIKAVDVANSRGVLAQQGTADQLSYPDGSFDIVVFGFCLYLCDREDLFKIAMEVDRVTKSNSWIIILDFFLPHPVSKEYHHRKGVKTHKMDYRSMFLWHPYYQCFSHEVFHHENSQFSDDPEQWTCVSVLRKNVNE